MTAEAKKGYADKLHMELVPVEGIRADARALDYGAYTKGYGANSWLRTAEAGKFGWMTAYGALLRHLTAWVGGEDTDPESGLHHLDHVGANVKFLQTFIARGIGDDDRPLPTSDPMEYAVGQRVRLTRSWGTSEFQEGKTAIIIEVRERSIRAALEDTGAIGVLWFGLRDAEPEFELAPPRPYHFRSRG